MTAKNDQNSQPHYTAQEKISNFFKIGHFQQYLGVAYRDSQKAAIDALQLKPGMQILDVGIGNGTTLEFFKTDVNIVGIDISEPLVVAAGKNAEKLGFKNSKFLPMDACNLEFSDEIFDAVISASLLSVVPDPHKAFSEMVRVTKKNGLISVTAHFSPPRSLMHYVDLGTDLFSRKVLGFQTLLSPSAVESHPGIQVLEKKDFYTFGFKMNTLYLVKKL
jgi:ubiquinone/menaquinone biosynthesis C-methylase UbiE